MREHGTRDFLSDREGMAISDRMMGRVATPPSRISLMTNAAFTATRPSDGVADLSVLAMPT
jgi:hypothetical protein